VTVYVVNGDRQKVQIEGAVKAMLAVGVERTWLPGAPGQKTVVAKVTAPFWGMNRELRMGYLNQKRDLYKRDLYMEASVTDAEIENFANTVAAVEEERAVMVRLANAREKAATAIAGMPRSKRAFLRSRVETADLLLTDVLNAMRIPHAGYEIDEDDVEDFRLALGAALGVLKNAAVRFDDRANAVEILAIVDQEIDAVLPVGSES
jgi:hypothetical protein